MNNAREKEPDSRAWKKRVQYRTSRKLQTGRQKMRGKTKLEWRGGSAVKRGLLFQPSYGRSLVDLACSKSKKGGGIVGEQIAKRL